MSHDLDHCALPVEWVPLVAGLTAAECITPTGERTLWLLADDNAGQPGCAGHCCAPHEGTGPMPRAVRERLGLVYRCGATTRAGAPCRTVVLGAGTPCGVHGAGR
jgi:hypothetical protein